MTQKTYPKVKTMIKRIWPFINPVRDKAWRQKKGCWGGKNLNIPMPGEKVTPPKTPGPKYGQDHQGSPTKSKEAEG